MSAAVVRTAATMWIAALNHFVSTSATAQHRNDNWVFGYTALSPGGWLNFTLGYPIAQPDGLVQACEGIGSISDTSGDLLFCSAGQPPYSASLFDANLDPMPNGSFMFNSNSTTQGSLILPRPGSVDRYDVFYLSSAYAVGEVRHFEVDMSLNSGLGDMVVGSMHAFADSMTEKLTGTLHANGNDYWILTHHRNDDRFMAYLLTDTGLDTVPVVSHAGAFHPQPQHTRGQMKVSHDGGTIGLCTWHGTAVLSMPGKAQLFHFDNATGEVSYWVDLPDQFRTYGCEISPDGCRFYVGGGDSTQHYIDQYALCEGGGDTNDIIASRTRVYSFDTTSVYDQPMAMATAPDGRIYVTHSTSKLAAINAPDLDGLACDVEWEAIDLVLPHVPGASHPNQVKNYHDSQFSVGAREPAMRTAIEMVPNPAKGFTWLHLPADLRATRAEFFDALGRLAGERALRAAGVQAIDLVGFAPGTYTIQFSDRTAIVGHARLVVEQ